MDGRYMSSMWIFCWHINGLIPFMSAIDHPIAILCFCNTLKSFSSYSIFREEEIITGSVDESPKNAYLRWVGSDSGGFSIDYTGYLLLVPSFSNGRLMKMGGEASNWLTHSMMFGLSEFDVPIRQTSSGSCRVVVWSISLTHPSTSSTLIELPTSCGCLSAFSTLKVTSSS